MKRYAVKFFRDYELIAVGHGKANDEEEAERKAWFRLKAMYENIEFDTVIVCEE